MGSPRIHKAVINGRMTVTRPRVGYVEVKVYAGADDKSELLADWEMPNQFRHDLPLVAQTAAEQTTWDTNNDGDTE